MNSGMYPIFKLFSNDKNNSIMNGKQNQIKMMQKINVVVYKALLNKL